MWYFGLTRGGLAALDSNVAEIFLLWFLFVIPITTVIALVVFMKRSRFGGIAGSTKLFLWITLAASFLVNALVLLGMWGSTY
jgi:hypothetical protein